MIGLDHVILQLQGRGGISRWWTQHAYALKNGKVPIEEAPYTIDEMVKRQAKGYRRRLVPWWLSKATFTESVEIAHGSYYRKLRSAGSKQLLKVATFHDDALLRGGGLARFKRYVIGQCLQEANRIFCDSEWSLRQCVRQFPDISETTMKVVPLPVEFDVEPEPIKGLMFDRPTALWVGKREGYKNGKLAIEALRLLPDWQLVCIGGEPPNDYEKSLGRALVHIPFASDAGLSWCYKQATVLWYPSLAEGFGYPPIEALMLGCPVIANKGHAVEENCGKFIGILKKSVPAELAEMSKQFVSGKRIEVGEAFSKKYSLAAYGKRISEAYGEM